MLDDPVRGPGRERADDPPPLRAEELSGTVFIAEEFDAEDFNLLSGRFSAHLEDGDRYLSGPQDVPVEEAIAWGRRHAEVVLVRLADSDVHWSAGAVRPEPDPEDGEDFPVWPEGRRVERRRPAGMEHLDLTTNEPIAWEVRLPRLVSKRRTDDEVVHLRDALASDPAVSDLRVSVETTDRVDAIFRFQVRARSHAEAMAIVFDIQERTIDKFPIPVDELPSSEGASYIDMRWNPFEDIRPAPQVGGGST